AEDLLDVLCGLVDKSVLVRTARERYRLLSTVREYGLDRLRAEGGQREVALRRRHRDWYLAMTARFEAEWFGRDELAWAERIRAELPNLRAALDFCLSAPDEAGAGQDMAASLIYYWHACGHLHEGNYWFVRALAADPRPTRSRMRALWAFCPVLLTRGDLAGAEQRARECLALAERLDDPYFVALSKQQLAGA